MHQANCAHCRDADQRRIAELEAQLRINYETASQSIENRRREHGADLARAAALEAALRDHASYFEKCGCVRVGDDVSCSLRAALDAHAAPVETNGGQTHKRPKDGSDCGYLAVDFCNKCGWVLRADPLVSLSEVEAAFTEVFGARNCAPVLAKLRGAR